MFDRHFGALYRFFSNKAGDAADDLIQHTFLACLEGRARWRGEGSFKAFLFSIARHKLYDHLRAKGRRADAFDPSSQTLADLDPSPSQIVANRRMLRHLLEALRRLPVELQVAVELYYWESMSGAELAEALGVPEGTVRTRLRLARSRLLGELDALAREGNLQTTEADLERWAKELRALLVPEK